jgi:hypothetical protein
MFDVTLRHLGGELKTLPVEYVTKTYISLRWGQSGIYDLNLAKNTLTARSQKAQRKGKAHWMAENIHKVRCDVRDYFKSLDNTGTDAAQLALRHMESMPK